METVKVSTSQHIDIDYPVAGIGERVAGYLLDSLFFFIIYIVFAIAIVISGIKFNLNELFIIIMVIIYGVGYVFYDLLCEIFMNGQSFGKKIMKTKVVSLDGAQPTLGQYFIRWVFRIVDFVLTAGLGGFLSVVLSENKQRIGDIVAGTTVIKTQARTKIDHIAFHPPVNPDYVPTFANVYLLSDQDIELVHEVVRTYYTTGNANVVYKMADKLMQLLDMHKPQEMNELDFLRVVINDYNHITSQ